MHVRWLYFTPKDTLLFTQEHSTHAAHDDGEKEIYDELAFYRLILYTGNTARACDDDGFLSNNENKRGVYIITVFSSFIFHSSATTYIDHRLGRREQQHKTTTQHNTSRGSL
jgi:hypothetical protein